MGSERDGDAARGSGSGWARTLWIGVCGLYAASVLWAAARLPDRVASHFGWSGVADGWSSRTGWLVFSVLIGVGVLVLPAATSLLTRGSAAFVNVPHKDYWLDERHPQRRAEFQRRFGQDMALLSAATGLLLVWMQLETVYAQRLDPPRLSGGSVVALIAYLGAVLGWCVWVMRVRYRPPGSEASDHRA